jgi:hypothetical protein
MTRSDHHPQWEFALQLLVEYEEMFEFVRLGLDKRSPAVVRGEDTSFVKLPLIVVRFCSSRPTAT